MALFYKPIDREQIAYVLGMSERQMRRDMKRLGLEFPHHCRMLPFEAEKFVIDFKYDLTDEHIIQRAKEAQDRDSWRK